MFARRLLLKTATDHAVVKASSSSSGLSMTLILPHSRVGFNMLTAANANAKAVNTLSIRSFSRATSRGSIREQINFKNTNSNGGRSNSNNNGSSNKTGESFFFQSGRICVLAGLTVLGGHSGWYEMQGKKVVTKKEAAAAAPPAPSSSSPAAAPAACSKKRGCFFAKLARVLAYIVAGLGLVVAGFFVARAAGFVPADVQVHSVKDVLAYVASVTAAAVQPVIIKVSEIAKPFVAKVSEAASPLVARALEVAKPVIEKAQPVLSKVSPVVGKVIVTVSFASQKGFAAFVAGSQKTGTLILDVGEKVGDRIIIYSQKSIVIATIVAQKSVVVASLVAQQVSAGAVLAFNKTVDVSKPVVFKALEVAKPYSDKAVAIVSPYVEKVASHPVVVKIVGHPIVEKISSQVVKPAIAFVIATAQSEQVKAIYQHHLFPYIAASIAGVALLVRSHRNIKPGQKCRFHRICPCPWAKKEASAADAAPAAAAAAPAAKGGRKTPLTLEEKRRQQLKQQPPPKPHAEEEEPASKRRKFPAIPKDSYNVADWQNWASESSEVLGERIAVARTQADAWRVWGVEKGGEVIQLPAQVLQKSGEQAHWLGEKSAEISVNVGKTAGSYTASAGQWTANKLEAAGQGLGNLSSSFFGQISKLLGYKPE